MRLNLNRGLLNSSNNQSSTNSSIISTPNSVQCSRSPSPIHHHSRSTSPQFNYDFNSELVDGINLSRAKSPLLSRPLSPISPLSSQLNSPLTSSNLSSLLTPNKARKSVSSHSIHSNAAATKLDKKKNLDDNELKNDNLNEQDLKSDSDKELNVHKTKSHQALNESSKLNHEDRKLKADNLESQLNQNDSNLIKMLSQNIIELTENLNLLFSEQKNETANQIKSSESKKDNDLIEEN